MQKLDKSKCWAKYNLFVTVFATLMAMPFSLPANAGGLENGSSSNSILFQPGRYAEFNVAHAQPSVDGVLGPITIPNLGGDLTFLQGGIKTNIGKRFDLAFQAREPIQLDVAYPVNPALGALSGLTAELNGISFSLLGRYRLNKTVSVFGGPRYQTTAGNFFFGPGDTNLERDGSFGFTVGLAYERRKQGFRATLTYQSEINHQNDTESALPGETTVSQSTPRSLAIRARGRLGKKISAFGGVQWSHSSAANLSIDSTVAGNVAQSDFRDTWRFDLGLGRRLTKRLSARVSGSYQNGNGEPAGNIFPTNGRTTVELGGRFNVNRKVAFTSAIGFAWIGDATALSGAQFENNRSLIFRTGTAIRF